ncbi:MAG: tetratricopeptide repeat protein [Steroidobacteraceae bacterium]
MARALGFDPAVSLQHAVELHRRGQLSGARALYQDILRHRPTCFDAQHLLGIIEYQTGNARGAVTLIEAALLLDPGSAAAHGNLASARQALGYFAAALAGFDRALALDPGLVDAHFNRGNLLNVLGDAQGALACFGRAIELNPGHADAHHNRGVLLQRLGRPEEALESYGLALAIRPDHVDAQHNHGRVLFGLRRPAAAIASYDQALALQPGLVAAHCDRAVALHELGRFGEALQGFDLALDLDDTCALAHSNRGVVLHELGRYVEAVASFDRAIALAPDYAQAHLNKSVTCLLIADYTQGWREHEWRWRTEAGHRGTRHFIAPQWTGSESLAGRTVLLHAERGLGDTLQFCRYVPLLAAQGARVVLEVQPELESLLAVLDGAAQIVTHGTAVPPCDFQCSLLSLPLAFATTAANIPARTPYLHCDENRRDEWRQRLGNSKKLRVGLVWSGGFRPHEPEQWSVNARRNIPLAALAPLAHPQIEFFSLQKGAEAEAELAQLRGSCWDGPALTDCGPRLQDFSDTAALIDNLDLVLSVDTATTHLAAAMGKPVWLLNRFDTCWRWLLDRSDSPWYPTLRLYRQQRRGDWQEVVQRIRADLHRQVA